MNNDTAYIIATATSRIRTAFRMKLELYGRISQEKERWIKVCACKMIKEYGYGTIFEYLNKEYTFFQDSPFYEYANNWIECSIAECPNCGDYMLAIKELCDNCSEVIEKKRSRK